MSTKTLSVGSLFSGIGGLDLGLERAGMHVIWQSEIDPYASRVLAKHWPNTPNLGNVKEINWHDTPRPDVICGGYPCQPFSVAGRRKAEADERHLFPWVADAIRILRPRYAILENVTGHLSTGFGTVQAFLAEIGYDSRWDCIPAAAVGAPHLRDRVFIIATPRAEQSRPMADSNDTGSCDPLRTRWNAPWDGGSPFSHTDSNRQPGQPERTQKMALGVSDPDLRKTGRRIGSQGQTQTDERQGSDLGRRVSGNDSREWWPAEPPVGRVAHGIPSRMDRLRGLGNAVVPQVAEHIGRIVMAHATQESES